MTGGDAGGQILGAGHVPQHHPGSGAVRDLQQRNRERVDLPADFDVADRSPSTTRSACSRPCAGVADGPSRAQPPQSRGVGRQLVRVGLGWLLGVQQRVGDLVDPVVVPARYVTRARAAQRGGRRAAPRRR